MSLGVLQDIGFTVNYDSQYVVTSGGYLTLPFGPPEPEPEPEPEGHRTSTRTRTGTRTRTRTGL